MRRTVGRLNVKWSHHLSSMASVLFPVLSHLHSAQTPWEAPLAGPKFLLWYLCSVGLTMWQLTLLPPRADALVVLVANGISPGTLRVRPLLK